MRQYVFIIVLTAAVTYGLSWTVWKLAMRYKLYPGIRERDVHKTPTPRLGGVAMFLGIATAFAVSAANPYFGIFWDEPQRVWSILAAVTLIMLVGVADDLWDLDWMIKLAAQFLAAGIIAVGGQLQIFFLPFGGITVWGSWFSIGVTILSIVIAMNAVNFIDGLDGLVAGVCLISNAVFFVYSYLLIRDIGATSYFNFATFIAAVLIGACIGFLPLNWSPAKLFMGDSGALVLGLLMATSAVAITGQLPPSIVGREDFDSQLLGAFIPIILPIIVVALPLADFGLAVIRRMGAGKSPFSPDRKHLHHRMLDMGHSDRDSTLIFYAWTSICSLAVLLMYIATQNGWPGDWWIGIAFGGVGIIACLVVTLTPSRRAPRGDGADTPAGAPTPQEA
ncbi:MULTISPECIES: MraY family glycosyltransferase [Microbacterium]|uniref:Undecaprenyl-phosphate alpha-N-acetylglucosaminyl 1-phosphate transferase n=1 Tax=Microbacterium barkeri TaxID=33917 RepID=A0A9W6H1E4_9MICO|nr:MULTISPECIES: MraY family glycosyltransferase [Microbacterium]MDI6942509.1 MraY family glycosyltransferase [Microbacterium barkeri]MDR6875332.1 UDP-GlcNAc:undecaprenyl-phosphate GlcNAc-1-phosphate transferase [Microbacterium barkeri]WRH18067.1 undecaprenyl/decaprenyl-phosphate alpha-N-acetylglucosaminyl 1-phosphate transferase [Microbacterium sp. JZ37]GLJ60502.1 undecaprenyl-phosphate alpha-N-acetylglucosaminyl 1-phosphate transferase [Microbacterium barkeri]